ncbi:MAG: hypothetical protein IKC28_02455 [Clostridia bacterium]|nr:hypothetical protein [Clostridia bacterium]
MTGEYQYVYGSSNAASAEGIIPNPNRRMTISHTVDLPDSVWDARTGRLVPQLNPEARRQRVQGMTIELNRLNKQEARAQKWADKGLLGKRLNLSTALLFAMALFVMLGMFTLSHHSAREDWNDKVQMAGRDIDYIRQENAEIQDRIDEAKRDNDIQYRAANELGMVHASDAHSIALNAVDAYPQQMVTTGYTAEVVVDGWGEEHQTQLSFSASIE